MLKKLLTLLSLMTLVGCAAPQSSSTSRPAIEVLQGGVKVIYSESGDFRSLSSTASAPVLSDLPSAKDEAVSVATLRARRQISEFLNVDIKSEQFTETVTTSLQESSEKFGAKDAQTNSNIATRLRESITQNSQSIIRGSRVESSTYDSGKKVVVVTVSASNESMQSSRKLESLMK